MILFSAIELICVTCDFAFHLRVSSSHSLLLIQFQRRAELTSEVEQGSNSEQRGKTIQPSLKQKQTCLLELVCLHTSHRTDGR